MQPLKKSLKYLNTIFFLSYLVRALILVECWVKRDKHFKGLWYIWPNCHPKRLYHCTPPTSRGWGALAISE